MSVDWKSEVVVVDGVRRPVRTLTLKSDGCI